MPKRYEYNLADLFGYALGDVDSGAEAAYAQVGRVWVDGHPALTAQTVKKSKEKLIYENSKLSRPFLFTNLHISFEILVGNGKENTSLWNGTNYCIGLVGPIFL